MRFDDVASNLKRVQIEKGPSICAITAAYTPREDLRICFKSMQDWIADKMSSYYDNFFVPSNSLTKAKSQLHIPLPIKVCECLVHFRIRYIVYAKKGTKRSNFLNQLCFYYTLPSGKKRCFKLFCNGVIHVTGFNDTEDMDARVVELYRQLHQLVGSQAFLISISDMKRDIQMMNMTVKLTCKFYLNTASLFLSRHLAWSVSYEPELYSAMVIDSGHFKANVFSTGSIIITGVKSLSALEQAYSDVLGALDLHFDNIVC